MDHSVQDDQGDIMPWIACPRLLTMQAEPAAGGSRTSTRSRKRLLLEFCCGPESKLGNRSNMVDNDCVVIRLTEEHDMTTEFGYMYAISRIREHEGHHITLWGSMPCTGGSPWQYVNECMYYRNGDDKAIKRLRGLRTTFRKLFWAFRGLTDEVTQRGGTVCLEWPTPCQYWRDPQVREYLLKNNMIRANLHGCAYGLVNKKKQHMKKPWSIATTSEEFARGIELKCDGTHRHVEARGRDCKLAEEYTDAFARRVHKLIAIVADGVAAAAAANATSSSASSETVLVQISAGNSASSARAPASGLGNCAVAAPSAATRASTPGPSSFRARWLARLAGLDQRRRLASRPYGPARAACKPGYLVTVLREPEVRGRPSHQRPHQRVNEMPSFISHGHLRGIWQLMFFANIDCPIVWGYPPIQHIINNADLSWQDKYKEIRKQMRELVKFAGDILEDEQCELRYRAGCDTMYDPQHLHHFTPVRNDLNNVKINYWSHSLGSDNTIGTDGSGEQGQMGGRWTAWPVPWVEVPNLYLVLGLRPGCTSAEAGVAKRDLMRNLWKEEFNDPNSPSCQVPGFFCTWIPEPSYEMGDGHDLPIELWRAFWVAAARGKTPWVPGLHYVGGLGHTFPVIKDANILWDLKCPGARQVRNLTALVWTKWGDPHCSSIFRLPRPCMTKAMHSHLIAEWVGRPVTRMYDKLRTLTAEQTLAWMIEPIHDYVLQFRPQGPLEMRHRARQEAVYATLTPMTEWSYANMSFGDPRTTPPGPKTLGSDRIDLAEEPDRMLAQQYLLYNGTALEPDAGMQFHEAEQDLRKNPPGPGFGGPTQLNWEGDFRPYITYLGHKKRRGETLPLGSCVDSASHGEWLWLRGYIPSDPKWRTLLGLQEATERGFPNITWTPPIHHLRDTFQWNAVTMKPGRAPDPQSTVRNSVADADSAEHKLLNKARAPTAKAPLTTQERDAQAARAKAEAQRRASPARKVSGTGLDQASSSVHTKSSLEPNDARVMRQKDHVRHRRRRRHRGCQRGSRHVWQMPHGEKVRHQRKTDRLKRLPSTPTRSRGIKGGLTPGRKRQRPNGQISQKGPPAAWPMQSFVGLPAAKVPPPVPVETPPAGPPPTVQRSPPVPIRQEAAALLAQNDALLAQYAAGHPPKAIVPTGAWARPKKAPPPSKPPTPLPRVEAQLPPLPTIYDKHGAAPEEVERGKGQASSDSVTGAGVEPPTFVDNRRHKQSRSGVMGAWEGGELQAALNVRADIPASIKVLNFTIGRVWPPRQSNSYKIGKGSERSDGAEHPRTAVPGCVCCDFWLAGAGRHSLAVYRPEYSRLSHERPLDLRVVQRRAPSKVEEQDDVP